MFEKSIKDFIKPLVGNESTENELIEDEESHQAIALSAVERSSFYFDYHEDPPKEEGKGKESAFGGFVGGKKKVVHFMSHR